MQATLSQGVPYQNSVGTVETSFSSDQLLASAFSVDDDDDYDDDIDEDLEELDDLEVEEIEPIVPEEIEVDTIAIKEKYAPKELTVDVINRFGKLVGEDKFKVYDTPNANRVKVYYENASLLIDFSDGVGIYEKVTRRPVFFQSNVLHRNSLKGWKWASDIFATMLILISVTGLFILKGKKGISGRGKWLIAAGGLPPLIALILYEVL